MCDLRKKGPKTVFISSNGDIAILSNYFARSVPIRHGGLSPIF